MSIWRPFTQMQLLYEEPPFVKKAKGCYLYLQNKKKVLDAISSWWLITHGHCQKEIVKAIQKQAQNLDQVLFANFTHQAAEDLVEELKSLLPSHLSQFFFSDNGSTSIEVGLKMAIQSWNQKGFPEKNQLLSFTKSYHGDTVGAMSLSAPSSFTKPYRPLLFSTVFAEQAHFRKDKAERYYEDFERKLEKHYKTLAAVIVEPFIQGAGGMIIWPQKALEHICKLTKEAGLYLIFDEVMTGFGRTGTLFALEQLQPKPDILCLSKGLTGGFLPLALTIASQNIYQSFLSQKKERALLHGHSFTGNPLSCAAALANIKKIKKEKTQITAQWKKIESIHKQRALAFQSYPEVQDVRWKGLVAAVEKKNSEGYSSKLSQQWSQKALEKNIFLRPLGDTVYILPPYSIKEKELHQVWDLIEGFFKN